MVFTRILGIFYGYVSLPEGIFLAGDPYDPLLTTGILGGGVDPTFACPKTFQKLQAIDEGWNLRLKP